MAPPIAHLAACIGDAPEERAPRSPYDAAYWLGQSGRPTFPTAPPTRGAPRRACRVDIHAAYVEEARDGRRDLDGRLDGDQAGRAFGLAYSAVVAERSRRSAEGMEGGRDYNSEPLGL